MVWVRSISQIVAQRSQFGIICNRWGDKWHEALITQAYYLHVVVSQAAGVWRDDAPPAAVCQMEAIC